MNRILVVLPQIFRTNKLVSQGSSQVYSSYRKRAYHRKPTNNIVTKLCVKYEQWLNHFLLCMHRSTHPYELQETIVAYLLIIIINQLLIKFNSLRISIIQYFNNILFSIFYWRERLKLNIFVNRVMTLIIRFSHSSHRTSFNM